MTILGFSVVAIGIGILIGWHVPEPPWAAWFWRNTLGRLFNR